MSKYDDKAAAVAKLEALWHSDSDEFLKFERIADKLSTRPDLHAFMLLDKLCPGDGRSLDMLCGAEHDEIWIAVDPLDLVEAATEEQLIDLHRCGVRCDGDMGLCMFA